MKLSDFKNILETKPEIQLKTEIVDGVEVGIISYMFAKDNTFDSYLAKECRGITFNMKTGEVISRPFHKFFNIGERPETQIENVSWDNIIYIGEKFDGSLVTPVLINDKIFWKSKKSFYSDVAIKANKLFNENYNNSKQDIIDTLKQGITPIFEYIGPDNKIVIDYSTSKLMFLNARNNLNGEYFYGMKTKKINYDWKEYIKDVRNTEGIEGYVLYDGNDFYKLKTQWYIDRHKLISKTSLKNIIKLTLDDVMDDIIGSTILGGFPDRAKILSETKDRILDSFNKVMIDVENIYKQYCDLELKEFALIITKGELKKYSSALFSLYKKEDKYEDVLRKTAFNIICEEYGEEINNII
jgi:RNA ligase